MRLEFEPNVTAIPLVENEMFDDGPVPGSHGFQEMLKKGISAAQNGDRDAARSLLARSTELDPKNEEAWMWLASVSDYPEELLAFLQNVLEINPSNERAIEWQKATQSLLAKTFVQRGIDAHSQADVDRARQFFEQALSHDAQCEMAWFWLGSIASSVDERTQCLQRVLEIDPQNVEAQNALNSIKKAGLQAALDSAKKQALAGKHKKALSAIDEVLTVDPLNVDTWLLRSHVAADLHEKLISLEKALEIDPGNHLAASSYEFLRSALLNETPSPVQLDVEPEKTDSSLSEQSEPAHVVETDLSSNQDPTDQHIDHGYEEPEASAEVNVDTTSAADDGDIGVEHYVSDMMFSSNGASDRDFEVVTHDRRVNSDLSETLETGPSDLDHAFEIETPMEYSPFYEQIDQTPVVMSHSLVSESETSQCPYCNTPAEASPFACSSCGAVLTLSDIEALLSNTNANVDIIQGSLTAMELEWNQREFNVSELLHLAVGYLNLRSFELGLRYLQEASRLDPNNVILTGQLTAVAIRLEELRRHDKGPDTMPKGKSILVVDDSATVRKLIAGKLEKSGHKVICAVDGVEGLACIAEALPDLVLLDIGMPRMDGYEVCREIRANPAASDLPVVMISGKDGFFDKVRGRMAGCTGYVTKPFGPETLMKALDTYLKREPASDC